MAITTLDIAKKMTFTLHSYADHRLKHFLFRYTQPLSEIRRVTMQFSKFLGERVKNGEVTTSVRFWKYPHVMAGGHYRLDPGEVIVTSIREIGFKDISETMAKQSGFSCLAELLKTAQHGTGHHIYLIRFSYSEKE
jgi:hypothetical protein